METNQPVLVVWMEDELVHTNETPYCPDLSCPCHSSLEYHELLAMEWDAWQPYYSRSDAMSDQATADYYDHSANQGGTA